MEGSESIVAVVFSIWATEEGFLKRGREVVLFLTTRRIAFTSKTKMSMNLWRSELDKQLKAIGSSNNIMKVPREYILEILRKDIADEEETTSIPLQDVVNLETEEKRWGSELRLKFSTNDGKVKGYKFALVKSWVRYPAKDPIAFANPDWQTWINTAKSYM